MKGFTIMYDYRGKIAGMVISVLGIAALALLRLYPISINPKWTAEQHYAIAEWVALLGLFLVMFSKEKVDDERTKMVRLKALQISYMLTMSTTMALALSTTAVGEAVEFTSRDLFLIPATGVILYLLLFHVGLYFDDVWDYEDKGLWTNLRNIPANKWSILVYFGICAVLMLLLALLES